MTNATAVLGEFVRVSRYTLAKPLPEVLRRTPTRISELRKRGIPKGRAK